jgi:hypothetical protein
VALGLAFAAAAIDFYLHLTLDDDPAPRPVNAAVVVGATPGGGSLALGGRF